VTLPSGEAQEHLELHRPQWEEPLQRTAAIHLSSSSGLSMPDTYMRRAYIFVKSVATTGNVRAVREEQADHAAPGTDVKPVIAAFRERNILVGQRFLSLENWLRVSIGMPKMVQ